MCSWEVSLLVPRRSGFIGMVCKFHTLSFINSSHSCVYIIIHVSILQLGKLDRSLLHVSSCH